MEPFRIRFSQKRHNGINDSDKLKRGTRRSVVAAVVHSFVSSELNRCSCPKLWLLHVKPGSDRSQRLPAGIEIRIFPVVPGLSDAEHFPGAEPNVTCLFHVSSFPVKRNTGTASGTHEINHVDCATPPVLLLLRRCSRIEFKVQDVGTAFDVRCQGRCFHTAVCLHQLAGIRRQVLAVRGAFALIDIGFV